MKLLIRFHNKAFITYEISVLNWTARTTNLNMLLLHSQNGTHISKN